MAETSSSISSSFGLAAEEMFQEFQERLRGLETLALLRVSPSAESDLRTLTSELSKAEAMMDELSRMVDKDFAVMNRALEVTSRLKTSRSRALKLDRHLLMVNQPVTTTRGGGDSTASITGMDQMERLRNDEQEVDMDGDSTFSIVSKANQTQTGPFQLSVPTLKQFESIPKYMRSVLSYEIFKNVCELINMAAERKRMIMEAPFEKLGPTARTSLATWKDQVTSEVSNLIFVSDDDVMVELENDRTACKANDIRAGLQCLRNLNFIRVSPHEGINRYIFLK